MTSSCTSSSSSNFFPTRCFFRWRNKWKSLGYSKQQQFVCEFPLDVHLLRWEIVWRNAPRIWRDFGSALSFQTRLTQTKPVLPPSNSSQNVTSCANGTPHKILLAVPTVLLTKYYLLCQRYSSQNITCCANGTPHKILLVVPTVLLTKYYLLCQRHFSQNITCCANGTPHKILLAVPTVLLTKYYLLCQRYSSQNIIRMIKTRRIRQAGHVACMGKGVVIQNFGGETWGKKTA